MEGARAWMASQGLTRKRRGHLVAGVCAGLGAKLGVSPNILRVVFVAALILPPPSLIVYALLWVLMPREAL